MSFAMLNIELLVQIISDLAFNIQLPQRNDIIDCNVKEYINYEEDLVCPISLENIPLGEKYFLTTCNHKFSKKLIDWLKIKKECPLCKTNFGNLNQRDDIVSVVYRALGNNLRKKLLDKIIELEPENELIELYIFLLNFSYEMITESEKEELIELYLPSFDYDGTVKSAEKLFPWL